MDGGDIFYILIFIFFVISGIIKKLLPKKKEEVNRPVPTTMPIEEENDFDDWYNSVDTPQPSVVPEISKEYSNQYTSTTINNRPDFNQTLRQNSKAGIQKNINLETVTDNKLEIEIDTVNEARKAFIYSEIFQRKY